MNSIPSKEVMETDLKNTRKEMNAYSRILTGYKDLQSLPENPPNKYRVEIMKFDTSLGECMGFYEKLKAIYKRFYENETEIEEVVK